LVLDSERPFAKIVGKYLAGMIFWGERGHEKFEKGMMMNRRQLIARITVLLCAIGIVSSLTLVAVAAPPANFEQIRDEFVKPDSKTVLVAAHRGLSGISLGRWDQYPENSLPGVAKCIEMGIDIVEIDVRKTKDGHLVLMHDETVDRTTNGHGAVTDLTLAQIKELRMRHGTVLDAKIEDCPVGQERVPTFEEMLVLCKGKCIVNIDKAWDIIPECYAVLKKTGTVQQALVSIWYDPETVRKSMARFRPPVFCKPGIGHEYDNDWHNIPQKGWELLEPYTRLVHPPVIELVVTADDDPIISAEAIRLTRKNGSRIWTDTLWDRVSGGHTDAMSLQDPKLGWGWMVDRGVNIILSDESERLLEYLRSEKLHW
jgi:glycerophosphoryl diester phosphodiesterase